jgi:hypothetical protein
MNSRTSNLDDLKDFICGLKALDKTNPQILKELAQKGVTTSEASLRRAYKRWELFEDLGDQNKVAIDGDDAQVSSDPTTTNKVDDPEKMIMERGLDPEEWGVHSLTLNEWDGPTEEGVQTFKQLKVNLKRKNPLWLPVAARTDGYRPKKVTLPKKTNAPQLVVFTGDQQAPFHDSHLHDLFLQWLKKNKPDNGILIGDTVDFPDISRHRLDPENTARVQDCVNTGYDILRDYVMACEATNWKKLCGNHDERIRNTLIDAATELYGIRRADTGATEPSVLSVAHLLRLDELGIDYLEPNGSYEHMQVNLSPFLAARHGWIARKGSGASALATLEHLGYSVIVGHTHRQSIVHKTTHDIDGNPTTLAAVETGCMCRIEGGLGYAVNPDWQNGFATAHIWPDGRFKVDVATFVNGILMWKDQRYE